MAPLCRMKSIYRFLLWVLLLPTISLAQEPEEKLRIEGYLKDLINFTLVEDSDSLIIDNLVHNRLNFFWYATEKFSANIELRTRFLSGDLARNVPVYGQVVDVNNDYFDLSYTYDNDQVVFHSMIDRLNLKWNEASWELKVGRQRINWGVNVAWNPNDILNAYSLYDFDYEERPGTDAIRFQKFIGYAGGYEIAIKMADSWEDLIAAGMYKWNIKGYDLQALGGIMKNNLTVGGGWAGNLGLVGFKGEFNYFHALSNQERNAFLASVSFDYSLKNSLYFNGSFFYNSYANNTGNILLMSPANIDVRSLSPYKMNTFLQSSYVFHPLISGGLMLLYYPSASGIFLNPSITLSALNNFDIDLISQIFIQQYTNQLFSGYLRLKYSF